MSTVRMPRRRGRLACTIAGSGPGSARRGVERLRRGRPAQSWPPRGAADWRATAPASTHGDRLRTPGPVAGGRAEDAQRAGQQGGEGERDPSYRSSVGRPSLAALGMIVGRRRQTNPRAVRCTPRGNRRSRSGCRAGQARGRRRALETRPAVPPWTALPIRNPVRHHG